MPGCSLQKLLQHSRLLCRRFGNNMLRRSYAGLFQLYFGNKGLLVGKRRDGSEEVSNISSINAEMRTFKDWSGEAKLF